MKATAIKILAGYLADMGPDDPAFPRNTALMVALEAGADLAPHRQTLYGLAPCHWSFDEILAELDSKK